MPAFIRNNEIFGGYNPPIDNLTSMNPANPLSANQGRILNEKITDVETNIENKFSGEDIVGFSVGEDGEPYITYKVGADSVTKKLGSGSEEEYEAYFKNKIREIFGDSITFGYNNTAVAGSPGNNLLSWSISAVANNSYEKLINLLEDAGYSISGSFNMGYSWQNLEHRETRTYNMVTAEYEEESSEPIVQAPARMMLKSVKLSSMPAFSSGLTAVVEENEDDLFKQNDDYLFRVQYIDNINQDPIVVNSIPIQVLREELIEE